MGAAFLTQKVCGHEMGPSPCLLVSTDGLERAHPCTLSGQYVMPVIVRLFIEYTIMPTLFLQITYFLIIKTPGAVLYLKLGTMAAAALHS